MAISQGHAPIVRWFSSNLWLIYNSFVAEPVGSAAAIKYSRLQFRFGNWNYHSQLYQIDTHIKNTGSRSY